MAHNKYLTVFTHPSCFDHDTGPGHPECPERLQVVLKALEAEEIIEYRDAPRVTIEQLTRVHHQHYIDTLLGAIPEYGWVFVDSDTVISPGSGNAAFHAAGALCAAVDHVMTEEANATRAFCAIRPPGHHALPDQAMGFCLFNNIAIGAQHARDVHKVRRIAIVDFDVHHGNGTQAIFEDDADVLYVSTHQYPLFPGTGAACERGRYENVINIPLPAMSGSTLFREQVTTVIIPRLLEFDADLIMISAGFDGHTNDPLATLNLIEDDYAWVTKSLVEIAQQCCQGRVISSLEGGYNLTALASSCAIHVQALMT